MIMTVDIGNTNITVGAFDNERLAFVSRLQTNLLRTRDEYEIDLDSIIRLNRCNASQFDGAIISSVVPPLSGLMREAVQDTILSKRVYLVGPGLKTGLNIKIDHPGSLGADMVCASVAAVEHYPPPCIVISLATATTIMAVDAEGSFRGCALMAGVNISLEALTRRTAQLPQISLEAPGEVIGTNTVDAMKSGAVYGTACMIDGMCARIKERIGPDATLIATGGPADAVTAHCAQQITVVPHLVLEGLRLLYHRNAK